MTDEILQDAAPEVNNLVPSTTESWKTVNSSDYSISDESFCGMLGSAQKMDTLEELDNKGALDNYPADVELKGRL